MRVAWARAAASWVALVALSAGSCTPQREPTRGADPDRLASLIARLPAEKRDVLWIEGMAESTTFTLVRGAERFALFYVPVDMVAQASAGREGTFVSLQFVGGRDQGQGPTVATVFFSRLPDSLAIQPGALGLPFMKGTERPVRRRSWTVREYGLEGTFRPEGPLAFGELLYGKHAGLPFWIQIYYPAEMADGMGPRLGAILRSWIWSDDGTRLESSSPAS
jgi:hypothetical protein